MQTSERLYEPILKEKNISLYLKILVCKINLNDMCCLERFLKRVSTSLK